MTAREVESLKISLGPGESDDYSAAFEGYVSGLPPQYEEGYESLVGSVVIDYAIPAFGMPPSRRLDLDAYFPQMGDQGIQGSCAAWASVYYANTYLQAKIHGWTDVKTNPAHVMSPAWTYNKANGGSDYGSTCDKNMRIVSEIGSASMATMPYNQYDYLSWGGEAAWREAPLYRAGGFGTVRPDNIEVIKALLNDGYLVTFNIDSICTWYASPDYVLSYGEYDGGRPNHANVIVGYDDSLEDGGDVGAFRVANSRGTSFKDGGFYWITYEAMKKLASLSPIANYYLPKSSGPSYEPSVLFTWRLDPAGSMDGVKVVAGIGDPESPAAMKVLSDCWNLGSSSKIPSFMCVDMSEFKSHLDNGINEFYLEIGNGAVPSFITSFAVEIYGNYSSPPSQAYSSKRVPASTPAIVTISEKTLEYFSWAPKSPLTFEEVGFTDLSYSGSGGIAAWFWSFGDGYYSTSQNPSHSYSSHGEFPVTLTVVDGAGKSSSRTETITVRNRPPAVSMLLPLAGGSCGGVVELAANASDLDDGVAEVRFFYSTNDNVYFIGKNDSGPKSGVWTYSWDTTPLTIPDVLVYAVAFDGHTLSQRAYINGTINMDNAPPGTPEIISPKDGIRSDASANFSWLPAKDMGSGILGYTLEISPHPDFGSGIVRVETSETCHSEPLSPGIWYWRVRSQDLAGNVGSWSETRSLIADAFLVNESGSSRSRADVSSQQFVWFRVLYQYDLSIFNPSNRTVFVNGSAARWNEALKRWEAPVIETTAGEYVYSVSKVIDADNPISTVNSNASMPSILFDRIVIDSVRSNGARVGVGRCASLYISGHYECDSSPWYGKPLFNDSLCKDSMGTYWYSIVGVADDPYNLTAFSQPASALALTFDEIKIKSNFETGTIGACLVTIELNYGFDGTPVHCATVNVNGFPAEETVAGRYEAAIETPMPYAVLTTSVSLTGFGDTIDQRGILLIGNLAVWAAAFAALAVLLFILVRLLRTKCSSS
ncbi:MAG: PKD domain-containing protein [Candidatus Methanosuratincola sp.]|jgi:PKD repeat protein|nr:PKD domain-containing protein [Candidatus Methanosuratincola sp.]